MLKTRQRWNQGAGSIIWLQVSFGNIFLVYGSSKQLMLLRSFMERSRYLGSGTAGYEKKKAEFDQLIHLGETVWTYVCCGPEGNWLNRFLDFHLIRGRLLFWGCARNRISGFLHWGFNQFPGGMDPFKGTSCPNDTGIGTAFPCGDSFLVYPGKEKPEISMRLEAQRRGAEDAALWGLLLKEFRSFTTGFWIRCLRIITHTAGIRRNLTGFIHNFLESLEKYS